MGCRRQNGQRHVLLAIVVGTVVLAACTGGGASSGGTSAALAAPALESAGPDPCGLVDPAVAERAVGAADAASLGTPARVTPGSCSWHSGDPTCTLRSVGIELTRGAPAAPAFAAARAAANAPRALAGVGDAAFFSADLLPPGSAVEIAHLDVLDGDVRLHVTLLGRVGSAGDSLLREVAANVLAHPDLHEVGLTTPAAVAPPPPSLVGHGPALPNVVVTDLASGSAVALSSLAPSRLPLLVWFWAPSCPYCNQEAAGVGRFARDHAGSVTVVGLGSHENLGAARSFVTRHGLTSLKMLWDETGTSWSQLGVVAQPEAVLFDRAGRVVGGWSGGFDAGAVLRLAAEPA